MVSESDSPAGKPLQLHHRQRSTKSPVQLTPVTQQRPLALFAPGITQGYVLIEQFIGNNPFLAYAVINDGNAPGERSGDGAYLPAQQ